MCSDEGTGMSSAEGRRPREGVDGRPLLCRFPEGSAGGSGERPGTRVRQEQRPGQTVSILTADRKYL